MEVSYSADQKDIDEPLAEAKAERPAKSIKLRLQPAIFRLKPKATDGSGTYQAWRGVAWTVECDGEDDAIALREGLRMFFETVKVFGAEGARAYLDQAIASVVDVPETEAAATQ